jgi:hypothetical protein
MGKIVAGPSFGAWYQDDWPTDNITFTLWCQNIALFPYKDNMLEMEESGKLCDYIR